MPRSQNQRLFGATRSALLAILYGHTDQAFYLRQLDRTIGAGHGALQRELKALTALGLIVRKSQGNQVLYQADSTSLIFAEMKSLIIKTLGAHDVLRSALAPLSSQIQLAFIYGSVARQQELAGSDIDLMVVGGVSFSDIVSALGAAQRALGREINPTVFSEPEFHAKLVAGNHFLQTVMSDKKILVTGAESELARLAQERLAGPAHHKP